MLTTIKLIFLKMKKLFLNLTIALFATLVAGNEIRAQKISGRLPGDAAILSTTLPGINMNGVQLENDSVNTKALRHFGKSFKRAKDVKWMRLKDGYMATFILNDVIERVYYYPKGNLAGTQKGYEVDKLPGEIHSIVTMAYPGYPIVHRPDDDSRRAGRCR